jgi:hypothetical protein
LLLVLQSESPLMMADAVYMEEILDKDDLSGVFQDRAAIIRTIAAILKMRRNGVKIITGHDPDTLKKAPLFYE